MLLCCCFRRLDICAVQVLLEAQRVFGALLKRQQNAERDKSVLAMLKRYESLFRLPARIRQATQRGEYEQVVAEHRKAKALMESLASSSSELWHNLFLEVAKVRCGSARPAEPFWLNP